LLKTYTLGQNVYNDTNILFYCITIRYYRLHANVRIGIARLLGSAMHTVSLPGFLYSGVEAMYFPVAPLSSIPGVFERVMGVAVVEVPRSQTKPSRPVEISAKGDNAM
jgi:hypothetical protein